MRWRERRTPESRVKEMTSEELREELNRIKPLDEEKMEEARAYQASLAKPPGSLGKLEDISVRLAGIRGELAPAVDKRRIVAFCSDNGLIEEGIGSAPITVTMAQAVNMTKRLTGMSSLAKAFGDDVEVIDVGIATPYDCPAIIDRKIRPGTRNIAKEAAMTEEEALQAIAVGLEAAARAAADGVQLLGVGEMGIGNTTTSSAVLSALTGLSVEAVTGRGGGLTDARFLHKKEVINGALSAFNPDPDDPVDVIAKVGGYDIAAMCGLFLGAAIQRIPVVIDGFISVVAALCAMRLAPLSKEFMFPSHASYEIGYKAAADALGLEPYLLLGMRLGEGSGCPIAFKVIEAAQAVMRNMATFEGASINDDYLDEIRGAESFKVSDDPGYRITGRERAQ